LAQASATLRSDGAHDPSEGQPAWDGWGAAQADALVAMAEAVIAVGCNPHGVPAATKWSFTSTL
jgi:hypothetical protein